jgi:Uncharacterized conserved protein
VDTARLAALRDIETTQLAAPAEVEATLGYQVGGVPPFCHDTAVPTYLDETLTTYDTVWAAAGAPEAVFPIAPETLARTADAEPVAVTE